MANFKYYENDYELAVLQLLEEEGWGYKCGYDIHRVNDEIILQDDFKDYLCRRYDYFSQSEIQRLVAYMTSFSNQSLYRSMKETYKRLMKGYVLQRDDGTEMFIDLFDFDGESNVFTAVNQYEFQEYKNRRPDIILFINGIPVSVFELKNPADITVSIKDAYDQTHIRYAQDIPSLMKYDFINVISDGANSRYGSLFSDYEFYFRWNSTDGSDYNNANGIEGIKMLVKGLFHHETILNILKSYIYIPDTSDHDAIILPKYYQYYGAEKLYNNILNEYEKGSGKGGTYWGATGCGKSYTMLFLSKRLTTSLELSKPTIILLTDRNDLDEQLSGDFENAKEFLIDENSLSIKNRKALKDKLANVESGGIYLMTIQKFSEGINLLSDRKNIICISDEAHRTQTNTEAKYVISKGDAKKTYGFAKYLRDSFPNATYVGFTGTPVDATLRVFGDVVVKYTMKQSLDDGSTVKIARLPGPREVQLDEKMAAACDEYYKLQAAAGANEYQIEQSKKDMTKIKVILGNPDRLDVVVKHFIWHYEKRVEEHATVNGKAMFVCYDREIAFEVYKRIKKARPEWFEVKKCAPEFEGCELDRETFPIEKVKLVCTNGKNDTKELSDLIGDSKTRKKFAKAFKDEKSNFKIAIVVDMWITGFDVPSMDTMYLDKPVETHNLIQTISRVNRVFKGKEEGLIVDYIGLEGAIMAAMKLYNGDINPSNGTEASLVIFKDFMDRLFSLMQNYDYSKFFDSTISPLERLTIINGGVEYVMAEKSRKDNFMGFSQRAKKAFDVCIGHDEITDQEVEHLHYFLCIRSVIYKMTLGDTPDATLMNQKVAELVNKAISSTYSGKEFNFDEQPQDDVQFLFSDEFIEKLKKIPYPNTKYHALLKLLKRAIKEFGKTNLLKATDYSKKLQKVIERYNSRNEISEIEEIIDDFVDNLSEELEKIHKELKQEKESFEELGITYDEKAFYDILVAIADKYGFKEAFTEEQYIHIAKEIKKLVSNKSKYTDWTNRQDVKDELYTDVAVLLKKNGYPPKTIDDTYDEIMKQVENYKKYVSFSSEKRNAPAVDYMGFSNGQELLMVAEQIKPYN
ncbi:MAG: type I restriction endonuclease subunit R [Blautia sp.]|nr:type I restriction endonuclease subunit R [Blautia sp.]